MLIMICLFAFLFPNSRLNVTGYAFVEFEDSNTAKNALEALQGKVMPGCKDKKKVKVNWATFGSKK